MEWFPVTFITFKILVLGTGMFFAIKWHRDQDRKDENKSGITQSPTEIRIFVTMIIVFAMSILGIVYAACWGNTADGGRGGAFGCALSFLMSLTSLMSKPSADIALNDKSRQADHEQSNILPEPDPATLSDGLDQLARLHFQAERMRAAFVARLYSVEREKAYLSVASVISTLAWKFGDIAAAWLNFR